MKLFGYVSGPGTHNLQVYVQLRQLRIIFLLKSLCYCSNYVHMQQIIGNFKQHNIKIHYSLMMDTL